LEDYFENPGLHLSKEPIKGEVSWKSPSNIALVKYWGKFGHQLPKNPSLSFSLKESYTQTTIYYQTAINEPVREFYFDKKLNIKFATRIWKFIDSLEKTYPFLSNLDLKIETQNSFPHSAGIASSASAMSALALCLVDLERKIFGCPEKEEDFLKKASYMARLGSGSAGRSVYPGFSIWGMAKNVEESSDNKFAIPFNQQIHAAFQNLKDAILIVDSGEKEVSSSAGHILMDHHPFAEDRIAQANTHLSELNKALISGDKTAFTKVVESEALSLHGLMMSSDPWFVLMKPASLEIIQRIKTYREKTGYFIAFTLDAGPNVHVIYSPENELEIVKFIEKELKPLCHQSQVIYDEMGDGPQKLKA
jgi:diphosphomevalonate decarboxylase